MSLSFFTPTHGPRASQSYTLPPCRDAHKPTHHINRTQNAQIDYEEMDGVYLSSGTGTLFFSYAEIGVVFGITPGWLTLQGYTASFGGMEAALYDFNVYVHQGGLGILEDALPSGFTLGKTGAAATKRKTSAVLHGDVVPLRVIGAPIIELTCNFLCPSGFWTYNDPANTLAPVN